MPVEERIKRKHLHQFDNACGANKTPVRAAPPEKNKTKKQFICFKLYQLLNFYILIFIATRWMHTAEMCGWNRMEFHETVGESVKFYSAGFVYKGACFQNWSHSKTLILNDCREWKYLLVALKLRENKRYLHLGCFWEQQLFTLITSLLPSLRITVLRFTPALFRRCEGPSHWQASIKTPVRWSYTVSRMTKHSDIMLCLHPLNHRLSHIWRRALERTANRCGHRPALCHRFFVPFHICL